jgi:hypothetical protein
MLLELPPSDVQLLQQPLVRGLNLMRLLALANRAWDIKVDSKHLAALGEKLQQLQLPQHVGMIAAYAAAGVSSAWCGLCWLQRHLLEGYQQLARTAKQLGSAHRQEVVLQHIADFKQQGTALVKEVVRGLVAEAGLQQQQQQQQGILALKADVWESWVEGILIKELGIGCNNLCSKLLPSAVKVEGEAAAFHQHLSALQEPGTLLNLADRYLQDKLSGKGEGEVYDWVYGMNSDRQLLRDSIRDVVVPLVMAQQLHGRRQQLVRYLEAALHTGNMGQQQLNALKQLSQQLLQLQGSHGWAEAVAGPDMEQQQQDGGQGDVDMDDVAAAQSGAGVAFGDGGPHVLAQQHHHQQQQLPPRNCQQQGAHTAPVEPAPAAAMQPQGQQQGSVPVALGATLLAMQFMQNGQVVALQEQQQQLVQAWKEVAPSAAAASVLDLLGDCEPPLGCDHVQGMVCTASLTPAAWQAVLQQPGLPAWIDTVQGQLSNHMQQQTPGVNQDPQRDWAEGVLNRMQADSKTLPNLGRINLGSCVQHLLAVRTAALKEALPFSMANLGPSLAKHWPHDARLMTERLLDAFAQVRLGPQYAQASPVSLFVQHQHIPVQGKRGS